MESWIYDKLNLKHLANFSLDRCNAFLKTSIVPLHEYEILCIGYRENQKHFARLKILASAPTTKTLQGPHEVILYESDQTPIQFWVWSLTTLRKKFLKYTDRLSFERSAFLVIPDQKVLLRLKSIRSLLYSQRKIPFHVLKTLPVSDWFQVPISPHSDVILTPSKSTPPSVCIRSKLQQQHFLEQSLTSYFREFENTTMTKQAIFEKFRKDILEKLDSIQHHYDDVPSSIPTHEINQEEEEEKDDCFLHDIVF